MTNFKEVSINSFLKERENRYRHEEANKLGFKRLHKIDFSGNIHLVEDKETRTGMILVKHGDLVISGINVEKGAIAVYNGKDDVLATIHYSSYSFDKSKIDVEYFKWFLRSKTFKDIVNSSIKGGIKTELKPKKFLPLIIPLPSLETQIEIRKRLDLVDNEINELSDINFKNEDYVQKLCQSILQEAVSGKLVPQNPKDEPASELLKKIKAEKEKLIRESKIKKNKSLLPITEEEIPYELPKGWEWVRLGDVVQFNPRNYIDDNLNVSFIPMRFIEDGFKNKHSSEIKKWSEIKTGFTHFMERDVAFAKITPCFENRKSAIMTNLNDKYGAGTTELIILRSYKELVLPELLLNLVKTENFINLGVSSYTGTAGQQRVKTEKFQNLVIGLPPLSEQHRIVQKVNQLMKLCDELEEKVKENQKNSELLMEAVLKEAFEA